MKVSPILFSEQSKLFTDGTYCSSYPTVERMNRLNKSKEFFQSIGLDPLEMDGLILHALEVIGAMSCISGKSVSKSKIDSTKLRIFWKTVQHITSHQLDEKKKRRSFLRKMLY